MLKNFTAFIRAVSREYIVLLTGGTLTAVWGLIERYLGRSVAWPWYCVLLLVFVIIACFRAWEKEYVSNRDGPEISIEWESHSPVYDIVKFKNVGKTSAHNVILSGFSWPELKLAAPQQISVIPQNETGRLEPQFEETLTSGVGLRGHLHEILRTTRNFNRAPLEVLVTFSDINGKLFERIFFLTSGLGKPYEETVITKPGKLRIR